MVDDFRIEWIERLIDHYSLWRVFWVIVLPVCLFTAIFSYVGWAALIGSLLAMIFIKRVERNNGTS